MTKRIGIIAFLSYLFFIVEVVLNDTFGVWVKPQLLLLLVVFWGLYSGIRYSIIAATFGGLIKDSYSILPFGTYLFVFIAAAYLTTIVRQNLYQPGSRFSRAVVAFFVLLATLIIQAMIYQMNYEARWGELFFDIFLPQLVATMVVVTFVFHRLRNLAGWLKI